MGAGAALLGIAPTSLSAVEPATILRSEGGLLEAEIDAGEAWVRVGGTLAHLFTYNGQVPGPRLEVRAGDTVRLHFTNRLAESTNLHFHGLHVPSTGNADNVFLEVAAGERFTYEFDLPDNHPSGTFWYHPHLHGSSARQLSRGLAGLFVVRGDLDDIQEVAAAEEHFLVLKDWALDRRGEVLEPSMMQRMAGREGSLVTVGDEVSPKFALQPGGLLRLRIINASASRFYRLKLEDHSMYVIVTDGGPLAAARAVEEILVSPGERVEVLVRGSRSGGIYRLENLPYNRGGMGQMGGQASASRPILLATVFYEGFAQQALTLPERLIPVEPLPQPTLPVRRFVLSEGMAFMINGRTFDHRRVDTKVRLGTVEDWEVINLGNMDHPFHLHTNSFQILNSAGQPESAWRDVMLVPARQTRRFRVRFDDFTGKAVYHCHILDHEDLGMMGVIQVLE